MTSATLEYSRREQRAWYLYDWANSAFATTVLTVLLGPYLGALAKAAAGPGGFVYPFGIPVFADSFFPYAISISVACQALVLPVVGAIADYGRRKRELLAAAAYLGSGATMAMFFLQGGGYLWGGLLLVLSNVSFGASIVLYNSFLPEIAPPGERDAVSSRGWAVGYVGGGLLLALNLWWLSGAEGAWPVRISLASAGLWWAVFTVPAVAGLRNRGAARALPPGRGVIGVAFGQLKETLKDIRRHPETLRFLIAFLLYNEAIQTVFVQAAPFASRELGLPLAQITGAVLMVQFVAVFGALGFNRLAAAVSAKRAVMASLALWTLVVIYAWAAVSTAVEFFVMAACVAVVMGGSQALSRSIYAQLVPRGKEAEYFSLYEIGDKGTSAFGPAFFGLALQFTGSFRLAILSLILFFPAGMAALAPLDVKRGQESAQ
jgi:UMF1 family MFS transporter